MRPSDINLLSLPDLFAQLRDGGSIKRLIDLAYDEDLGSPPHRGDITSDAWQSERRRVRAHVRARQSGVASGLALIPLLLDRFAPEVECAGMRSDADRFDAGDTIATFDGPAHHILLLERTLLNFLGRLCGVATLTAHHVALSQGTRARIFDTRKTTPGWRALEKYAVRCGGGFCHRLGLYDAMLIKDNHIAQVEMSQLTTHLTDSIRRARADRPLRFVEVEADSLDQLECMLSVETGLIDIILLDNMTTDQLSQAVAARDARGSSIELEASGGVTLDTIPAIARTGVERISVGAITHSACSLDLGLDIDP